MQQEAAGITARIGQAIGCGLDEIVALRDEVNALKARLSKAE